MPSSGLTSLSQAPTPSFNWFFLLELIVSCILVLFFLLYFNRLFATLLSYGIRSYTWHYYRAYVDIKALQISLLGGRVFFKGIRYHGENETIFVHGGFITWHYWKRAVKCTELFDREANGKSTEDKPERAGHRHDSSGRNGDRGEQGGLKKADTLPCRIAVKIYGLEWFIYNRTAAYDSILDGFGLPRDTDASPSPPTSSTPDADQDGPRDSFGSKFKDAQAGASSAARSSLDRKPTTGSNQDATGSGNEIGKALSRFLQLLPIKLVCEKGAIVIGNENTRSVLTSAFDGADGSIEACNAGPLDLYRQSFSFHFKHPVIHIRPNPDFTQNQIAAAKGLGTVQEEQPGIRRKRDTIFNYRLQRRRAWHAIRDLIPYFQTSVESFYAHDKNGNTGPRILSELPNDSRWIGLSRYLDERNQDDHEEWSSVEYARFSTLLDSPGMSVTYFWDIPGCVENGQATPEFPIQKLSPDINGAPGPEWSIDIKIEGGSINYGPWADRERIGLQNLLFPNSYRSSQPAERLVPGQLRQNTILRLRMELTEETTLRIPTKEQSQDWLWKGRADAIRGTSKLKKQQQHQRRSRNKEGDKGTIGPDIRPFGWLSLRVAGDSTINYTMDMVASSSGYSNQLDLDLRDSKMSSSVNHGLLWQCSRQLVTCDLSNPLCWNTLRTWTFNVESQDMELFLLRDHLFLVTDLVGDWASGPPPDYGTFVPFIYKLNLSFSDLRLFVNVNDSNIINNPSDLDDNRFLTIKGKEVTSAVTIPLDKFKPEKNAVDFNVNIRDGGVDFLTPLWDTLHTFLPDKSTATLESVFIGGTYDYYSLTSPELTDTLLLNVHGHSPRLYLYGFLIHCFMTVRENYFGEDMHFRTLEEFQELVYPQEQTNTPRNRINPNHKTNDLDVILHVVVEDPCALLPGHLYDDLKFSRLTASSLEVDLRFTNYYMDMHFTLPPLKAAFESRETEGPSVISDTQLFIDGIQFHGHRLFGLPPTEPTYMCNWDFDIGQIIGECSPQFLNCLLTGLQSFDMSFDNDENKLPPLFPIVLHDVTFLRAKFDMIHISVLLDPTAFILSSGPIAIEFNDWINSRFSKRMKLLVPELSVAAVGQTSADQIQKTLGKVTPLALFQTTIKLKMAQRQNDIGDSRKLQQEHIRAHDQRTDRTPWLLFDWEEVDLDGLLSKSDSLGPPNMAIPAVPEPLSGHPGPLRPSSLRHVSSNASSRSFIVSSDSSSLRSVSSKKPQSVKRARNSSSENGSNKQPCNRNRWMDPLAHTHDPMKESLAAAVAGDSNPWSMPKFSLYKLALDTSKLPSQEVPGGARQERDTATANPYPSFSPLDGDGITHTHFACELPAGIRGFCTPDFLFIMSDLTGKLQPKHPVDILDSLQRDIVSDIVGYEKSLKNPNKSTAFAIRVPVILLKLVNLTEPSSNEPFRFQDEYNIGISQVRTEVRTNVERKKHDLLGGIKSRSTIHAGAEGLSVSIEGSRVDASQEKAGLGCVFGDLNLWIVSAPMVRSHLQMRSFDTVTSTKSVEHLAYLVRRTTTMLDSVTSSLKRSSSLGDERLRFLIYSLTQRATDMSDPAFLTRISYVLRVAPAHLRLHDSWKIISRIRNVFNNLPVDEQQKLAAACLRHDLSIPRNARSAVLSSFDKWRAWDLAHVEKSYVMRRVWDDFDTAPLEKPAKPMSLSSTVKSFRFAIDAGPKGSEFIVEDLETVLSTGSKMNPNDKAKRAVKVTILQSYCSSISLHLRWEILDLVEGLMRTMSTVKLESTASPNASGEVPEEQSELQIVCGTDTGTIILDGINVKLELTGKALRNSLVYKSDNTKNGKDDLSVLIAATEGFSELSSLSRVLMIWKIGDPYIYGSRTSEERETELKRDWKIAGSCKKLRYDMREDPLSLTHIADRLIQDEIRHIRDLVGVLNLQSGGPSETVSTKRPVHDKWQIALFLDDYQLSFSLLPSLRYTIAGEVARTSVMPTKESMIEVDFDVKKNSHSFLSSEGDKWHALSVLEIPPINGRVVANVLSDRTELEVDVTIELIRLEASALRSLYGALTGPEVSHLVSDLKQNVDVLQTHLDDVLALQKPSSETMEPSTGRGLLYKARLAMAGTQIHATAPGLSDKNYSADMQFCLGMVRMRLDNGLENGYPMEYPEFHVDATQIRFDLRRHEKPRSRSYGSFTIDAKLHGTSIVRENGEATRSYHLSSGNFDIELYTETAALVVDIAVHLQERIKTLDLSHEVKRFRKLRQRGRADSRAKAPEIPNIQVNDGAGSQDFFNAMYSLDLNNIAVGWNMATVPSAKSGRKPHDLVFSIKRVDLSNKKNNAAKLRIEDMQLQMVPFAGDRRNRSLTSALMPELVFNVAYSSTGKEVRLAFQAAGKSLDLRATSDFILPASMIKDSIASASQTVRDANALWATTPSADTTKEISLFGNKHLRSLLVDVDFAGAIVSLQGRHTDDQQTMLTATLKGSKLPEGKYGQYVQGESATTATFRAPGVAFKVQFEDNGTDDPALNAELMVDASTNIIYPTLVPLIMQMTATVKELMGERTERTRPRRSSTAVRLQPQKFMSDTSMNAGDAASILGRCKVNVGVLISKQEFSLSCQPVARVAATTGFESVYVTVNTVQSEEHGRFLSLLVAFNSLQASVKHVYSNESTASLEVKSMVMSLMNSKHLSNKKGISAILRVSPMQVALNAKQVQDLLLFREIWLPSNDEPSAPRTFQPESTDTQAYIVQRYQQVASASAFPWNATVAIEQLEVQLDLGSTLGKSRFAVNDLWVSSKKNSDSEETLCINFGSVEIESKGRMSGQVELRTVKVRTSIQWPVDTRESGQTPLIQASLSFDQLQAKASFDYQPFLVAHIAKFYFLMYNVRGSPGGPHERLFSILEGDKVQVFCTTLTASQSLALFQAWERLAQDKQAAYEATLKEIERYLRRRSVAYPGKVALPDRQSPADKDDILEKAPISLQTGVVVTIKAVSIGIFPSSLFDNQILKLEAYDAQARFDVSLVQSKIQSALGLTLGQLRVALSGISRPRSADIEELSVHEIATRAAASRGGTILGVPRLVASMETWQTPGSHQIDYIFQSTFEGKVDVGWNYSRISFIRDMWETHSRALASRLGKPLPPSAVRITGGPTSEKGGGDQHDPEKITAVVNVPQSKYTYTALEPPVIETPQLRDMGEATPPLEWIGLHRDKLPNVTHQIIIVTLLEIAKEVEDAYEKILGTS